MSKTTKKNNCPAQVVKEKLEQERKIKAIFADTTRELEEKMVDIAMRNPSIAKKLDDFTTENAKDYGSLILNQEQMDRIVNRFNPTYDQVMKAGFTHQMPVFKDEAFEKEYGFPYFLVNFEAENILIEWHITNHDLTLYIADVQVGKLTIDQAIEIITEIKSK